LRHVHRHDIAAASTTTSPYHLALPADKLDKQVRRQLRKLPDSRLDMVVAMDFVGASAS
jgi:hypothetical protein